MLTLTTILFTVLVAVPWDDCGWRANSWIDRAVMFFSVGGFNTGFVLGYILIYIFANWLKWPVQGYKSFYGRHSAVPATYPADGYVECDFHCTYRSHDPGVCR